jgi:hypothetical protein
MTMASALETMRRMAAAARQAPSGLAAKPVGEPIPGEDRSATVVCSQCARVYGLYHGPTRNDECISCLGQRATGDREAWKRAHAVWKRRLKDETAQALAADQARRQAEAEAQAAGYARRAADRRAARGRR